MLLHGTLEAVRAELDAELTKWLNGVESTEKFSPPVRGCKAIIAPHAGYSYSGPAAAWAYKSVDTTDIKRVFILGPSHHVYIDGCALSTCSEYETPLGALPLDTKTIAELRATGNFTDMDIQTDEGEHSIEMHLPYIRKVFEGLDIEIVPILVGSVDREKEQFYGQILAPYLSKPDTICVVSTDFCHWGARFSYTYYYPTPTPGQAMRLSRTTAPHDDRPIHESISTLDHEGMKLLTLPSDPLQSAAQVHMSFADYIARTKNTICGRHPIGVLLGVLAAVEDAGNHPLTTLQWVRYEQSSECKTVADSSVSYASAYLLF